MNLSDTLKRILPEDAPEGEPVPLRLRLRAWWDGAPLREVLAEEARRREAGGEGDTAAEGPAQPPHPDEFWTAPRIAVTEALFGSGEIVPGGTARTLDMIGGFGLTAEMNVLNIGAGLGGSARAAALEHGSWITGFELDPRLAAAAMEPDRVHQSALLAHGASDGSPVKMKLSEKAKIQHADLEKLEIRKGLFDCAFSRDALVTVAAKERLIKGVFQGLKPHSSFMFTDYFLAEGVDGTNPAAARWLAGEPRPAHAWTLAEAKKMMEKAGFDLRIAEDITAQQRTDVFRGFANFVAQHEQKGIPGNLIEPLLGIAELWGNRIAAMDAGVLTVCRLVGLRLP